MTYTTRVLRLAATLALALGLAAHAAAVDPVYTRTLSSLAVNGYDVVAYFEEARPVEGSARFETAWRGATWRFASAAHRDAFLAEPEVFAPQYGGYCAWAASQGKTAPGSPQVWKIVEGRLYLNVNAAVQKRWEKDVPGFIAKANANWPSLLADD